MTCVRKRLPQYREPVASAQGTPSLSFSFSHVKVDKNHPHPWFFTRFEGNKTCKSLMFRKPGPHRGELLLDLKTHDHHHCYYHHWGLYRKNLELASVIIMIFYLTLLAMNGASIPGCLSPNTTDTVFGGLGGCPMYSGIFGSTPGLHPLDTSSISTL